VSQQPIRLVVPVVGEDELHEIAGVLASGYLTQGPKVEEFERLVAERIGVRHAIATTSATTALHLALAALDVGPGDEVLVPDFTFPATANVVVQQGAIPVLVDVELETFAMDPADLERRITDRTRAIIPVHPFGVAGDIDAISAVALAHGLPLVEDAACAIGATYRGRPCGALGLASCFSFHPRKAITTGEGGMVTTDDDALAGRLRLLRNHGGVRAEGRFTFEAAGYNYRLSDILAAVGVAQLRRLDEFIAEKRRLAARYDKALEQVPGVRPPIAPTDRGHVYQSYVVLLDEGIDRDGVIRSMRAAGIETTLGTYALHAQPFFSRTYGLEPGDRPASLAAYRRSLTLPLYPGLSDGDLDRVVAELTSSLRPIATSSGGTAVRARDPGRVRRGGPQAARAPGS
jgi:perosamine synthetase